MTLFYTSSAMHIAKRLKIRRGKFVIRRFSDGEIHARIDENVRGKEVWVIASTFAPADNLLELVFLLDALKRERARINLLMPYFGYARQDRIAERGECLSSKAVCDWLKGYRARRIVIEIHSPRLRRFLGYRNIVPYEMIYPLARKSDVIVAPDKGAVETARKISRVCRIPLIIMEKTRPGKEKVKVAMKGGDVRGKKALIVDDMVSTGNTIIEASRKLREKGAKEINVFATHGLFSGSAVRKLEKSTIRKIYVTNTVPTRARSRKIKVMDISGLIERMIRKGIKAEALSQ